MNPLGTPFAQVTVADLVLVGRDGQVLAGRHEANPSGVAITRHLLSARPDVAGAVHAHTAHGIAFSTLGESLAPISQDACAFFEDHALLDAYRGVVDEGDAGAVTEALGPSKALVMRHHGLLTVGSSVGTAAWWFIALERACQVELLARSAGRPLVIDPATARRARDEVGHEGAARFSFDLVRDHVLSSFGDEFLR